MSWALPPEYTVLWVGVGSPQARELAREWTKRVAHTADFAARVFSASRRTDQIRAGGSEEETRTARKVVRATCFFDARIGGKRSQKPFSSLDQLAAAAGEDGRPAGEACPILRASVRGGSSDAPAVGVEGVADRVVAPASGVARVWLFQTRRQPRRLRNCAAVEAARITGRRRIGVDDERG